jgi:hypothetical protein
MGLALAAAPSLGSDDALQQFLDQTTRSLGFTFDCTLVALSLSLVIMLFIHLQQRAEEHLVLDAQQYCLERLQTKLAVLEGTPQVNVDRYNIPAAPELPPALPPPPPPTSLPPPGSTSMGRGDRVTRDFGHGLGGLS